jgi:hypothetical protein
MYKVKTTRVLEMIGKLKLCVILGSYNTMRYG